MYRLIVGALEEHLLSFASMVGIPKPSVKKRVNVTTFGNIGTHMIVQKGVCIYTLTGGIRSRFAGYHHREPYVQYPVLTFKASPVAMAKFCRRRISLYRTLDQYMGQKRAILLIATAWYFFVEQA